MTQIDFSKYNKGAVLALTWNRGNRSLTRNYIFLGMSKNLPCLPLLADYEIYEDSRAVSLLDVNSIILKDVSSKFNMPFSKLEELLAAKE